MTEVELCIRVLVVDDHPAMREGITAALASEADIAVVATAGNAEEATNRLESSRPDVVVMDYALPGTDGIALTQQLKVRRPSVRVLLLTATNDPNVADHAVRGGCDGFLAKTATPAGIVDAVRRLNAGEVLFDADLLIDAVRRGERSSAVELSRRELDVLRLLARGTSTEAMAAELYVSVNTIRSHVRRILEKLGAHSKLEAVAFAVRDHVLRPEDFSA